MNLRGTILFFLAFGASVSSFGQSRLVIEQPIEINDHREILWPKFFTEGEDLRTSKVLIFSQDLATSLNSGLEGLVELSQSRKMTGHRDILLTGLWKIFEVRAIELAVKPSESLIPITEDAKPYDTRLDTHVFKKSNVVQAHMVINMGLSVSESAMVYKEMQVGYRLSGVEGAKLAFRDFFTRQLDATLLHLGLAIESFRQVKAIEAEMKLSPEIKNDIKKPSFVRNMSNSKEDRMRQGIIREQETGRRHPNGPKSMQSQINEAYFDALKYQALLGTEIDVAELKLGIVSAQDIEVFNNHKSEQGRGLLDWVEKVIGLEPLSTKSIPRCASIFAAL